MPFYPLCILKKTHLHRVFIVEINAYSEVLVLRIIQTEQGQINLPFSPSV